MAPKPKLWKTGWKSSLSWWHGNQSESLTFSNRLPLQMWSGMVTMGNFPNLKLLPWLERLMPKMPKMPTVGWKEKKKLRRVVGISLDGWEEGDGKWCGFMMLYAAYDMEPEHDFFQKETQKSPESRKKGTSDLWPFLEIKDISGFKTTCSCSWSYIHLGSDLVIILT